MSVVAFAMIVRAAGTCPTPSNGGGCGQPNTNAVCPTCIAYNCSGPWTALWCLGDTSSVQCNSGTAGWSCGETQYGPLTNAQGKCVGCYIAGGGTALSNTVSGSCEQDSASVLSCPAG